MNRICEFVKQYGPLGGRILMASIFLISGLNKIDGFSGVAGYMAGKGIPFAEVALAITIVIEVGGALMIIFGWKAHWGAAAIFLWMIPVTLIFHNFWAAEAAQYQNQFNHFMKNVSIMGGLLYVMAFGGGPLALGNRGSA